MDCGIDGSYMEEGVAEIYILDTDELFSSYTKRLCMKVRNADSVTITMRGTEGSTTHVEVNKKTYGLLLFIFVKDESAFQMLCIKIFCTEYDLNPNQAMFYLVHLKR